MRRPFKPRPRRNTYSNPAYGFLIENATILLLFTSLGTLLALLPTFYEKIGNSITIGSFEFNGIILLFLTGILFYFWIILIFLILLEAANSKHRLTILGLSFTLFIFLYGVISSVFNIIKKYVIGDFVQWYVFLFFYIPMAVIILYGLYILATSHKNNNHIPRIKSQIIPLFLVALVLIGCFAFWLGVSWIYDTDLNTHHTALMNNFEQNVSIISESNYYSQNIPNSVGLGLSLSNLDGLQPHDLNDYTCHWTTNYGYFVSWIPEENRAIYLSNNTAIPGNKSFGKIFWAYPTGDIGKTKNNVTIVLTIENTSHTYQNNQTLQLVWYQKDIAQVRIQDENITSLVYHTPNPTCNSLSNNKNFRDNIPMIIIGWKNGSNFTAILIENVSYTEYNSTLKFLKEEDGRNTSMNVYKLNKNTRQIFEGFSSFDSNYIKSILPH